MARDDYDDRPRGSGELGPLDKMFRDTNIVILVVFSICCSGIAAILGLIGMLTAKDPKAKSNATLVLIIGGILFVLGMVANFMGFMGGLAGGAR
ncbi:MAG TPA: hypothetical protein VM533_04315 [Fimbriiglobus sp.]|jgi:uncharacterized membrane protein|nr:hypothetical protein [Fimbriiglobus sp.]